MVEERNEHYETQTKSQMNSVDNNLMRENDPRMPLFNERTTKVTNFGKGTYTRDTPRGSATTASIESSFIKRYSLPAIENLVPVLARNIT